MPIDGENAGERENTDILVKLPVKIGWKSSEPIESETWVNIEFELLWKLTN